LELRECAIGSRHCLRNIADTGATDHTSARRNAATSALHLGSHPQRRPKMFVTTILRLLPPVLRYLGPRRQLWALDDRMLADIGISRSEIDRAVQGRL
jgi:uncharacterized protein YjiS (DUF1127 family)